MALISRLGRLGDRAHVECGAAACAMFGSALALAALLDLTSAEWTRWAPVALAPSIVWFAMLAGQRGAELVRAWRERRLGADVRRATAPLGKPYRLIARTTSSPGRAEHVVIGPNGVFVIMTCTEAGRITASDRRLFLNGQKQWCDPIEDCRIEALHVTQTLRRRGGHAVPVHPVLCFTRALVAVGREVRGVQIVRTARLAGTIASTMARPPLTESEVDALTVALTLPSPVRMAPPPALVNASGFRLRRRSHKTGGAAPLRLVASPSSHPHAS